MNEAPKRWLNLFRHLILLTSLGAGLAVALPNEPVRRLPATDIAAACLDTQTVVSAEICYAFILGVLQTHEYGTVPQNRRICLHDGLLQKDIVVAVRRYIRRNMADLDQPADQFVLAALASSWPCE